MFDHVGGKIKDVALVFCWIGIIVSVICAIVIWENGDDWNPTFWPGLGVLVGGCLFSLLGSLGMYGFGEMIEEMHANNKLNEQIIKELGDLKDKFGQQDSKQIPVKEERSPIKNDPAPIEKKLVPAEYKPIQPMTDFSTSSCRPTTVSDQEVKCIFCHTLQSSKNDKCANCNAKFIK